MPAEIITVLSEQQERAGWYFFQMEIFRFLRHFIIWINSTRRQRKETIFLNDIMSFTEQVGNDFLTKPIAERLVVINLIFLKMEINGSDPLLYRVSLSVDPSSGIDLNHFGQIFRRLVRDGVISFRLDDVDHNSLSFSVAIKYI